MSDFFQCVLQNGFFFLLLVFEVVTLIKHILSVCCLPQFFVLFEENLGYKSNTRGITH